MAGDHAIARVLGRHRGPAILLDPAHGGDTAVPFVGVRYEEDLAELDRLTLVSHHAGDSPHRQAVAGPEACQGQAGSFRRWLQRRADTESPSRQCGWGN
jgi:hypothetical protein